jgi:4-amino-4-deoxy-L-arabinose transferase-like glycosyltransferase
MPPLKALLKQHWPWLVTVALVVAALIFRFNVVASWFAPAGDGVQYYQLSQTLIQSHRLAFAPTAPLQFSRLPGYPLFLSFVVHEAPVAMGTHLVRATRANVILDVGTALLILAIVRERGHHRLVAWAAFACVILFPLIIYLSCYGLSESLATFLTTLTLYCAVRAMRDRLYLWAGLGGVAFGLLQLVRIDGLAIVPAVALAFWWAHDSLRRRLVAGALFSGVTLLVFAPWPLRNLVQFGAPHVEGTAWMRQDGAPLPLAMMRWMRSYGTGTPGEDYDLMLVANSMPFDVNRPGIILPVMYDDAAEKQAVISVVEQYNRERFSPAVQAGFDRLADTRRQQHPLRHYIGLPLRRLHAEWQAIPEWELPMRSAYLNLPPNRERFGRYERFFFVLALLGGIVMLFRDRRLVAIVAATVAARSLLHAYAHPFPVQRYLVESFPALLILSGYLVGTLLRLPRRLRAALPWRLPARERA